MRRCCDGLWAPLNIIYIPLSEYVVSPCAGRLRILGCKTTTSNGDELEEDFLFFGVNIRPHKDEVHSRLLSI